MIEPPLLTMSEQGSSPLIQLPVSSMESFRNRASSRIIGWSVVRIATLPCLKSPTLVTFWAKKIFTASKPNSKPSLVKDWHSMDDSVHRPWHSGSAREHSALQGIYTAELWSQAFEGSKGLPRPNRKGCLHIQRFQCSAQRSTRSINSTMLLWNLWLLKVGTPLFLLGINPTWWLILSLLVPRGDPATSQPQGLPACLCGLRSHDISIQKQILQSERLMAVDKVVDDI